ncbi:MAG TPA: NYN domain-containing protein, partial [Thermoanaerobaculia bacterium]|nr:NYN domain-containing protein [Thermoanaerobaculia bacterium]
EPVPFPAAEAAEGEKKPRRGRRGGVRHRKARVKEEPPAHAKPAHSRPATAPPAPLAAAVAPPPASAAVSFGGTPTLPARPAVEQRLAVFIDFENIALGARDAQYKKFDINLVLQRLIEKGRIVFKKAYADWTRYGEYKREFHEAAIELVDIPQRGYTGKNSADIRMVVDAMDLVGAKAHITTFVILSGDSDFSPLVSKLKESDKSVIGVGVKNSTSDLLISNCDEFIFYEDLVRETRALPSIENLPKKQQDVFRLVLDSIQALQRENYDVIWGSMIKQTMQRKQPYFNETYYGYKSFSELLEDAQRKGLFTLKKDAKSGGYIVSV